MIKIHTVKNDHRRQNFECRCPNPSLKHKFNGGEWTDLEHQVMMFGPPVYNFCCFYLQMTKLSIARLCLASLAITLVMQGVVCPFPRDDPRSILNPLIVPWWRHAPLRVRQNLHLLVTGEPLPPNDLENLPPTRPLFRFRRPRLPRPRLPSPFRPRRPQRPPTNVQRP